MNGNCEVPMPDLDVAGHFDAGSRGAAAISNADDNIVPGIFKGISPSIVIGVQSPKQHYAYQTAPLGGLQTVKVPISKQTVARITLFSHLRSATGHGG